MQLNDKVQALVRNLKSKDQNILESSITSSWREGWRRLRTGRHNQNLDTELGMAGLRERRYEEAIDKLQHDLDALKQDEMKLDALANNPERQGSGSLLRLFWMRV